MSRVGKILEFSCRQPALCTGAQHQSRWVHILQPPLSRGTLSAVLSSPRQPEEMHHSRTTAVFVCISRMYIMCVCRDSRRSGLYFQLCKLHFSSDVLSIRFARPHIRCREPRRLPHLICRLLTHKLLINSRTPPPPPFFQLYSFVLFYAFFLFLFSLTFLPLYR